MELKLRNVTKEVMESPEKFEGWGSVYLYTSDGLCRYTLEYDDEWSDEGEYGWRLYEYCNEDDEYGLDLYSVSHLNIFSLEVVEG